MAILVRLVMLSWLIHREGGQLRDLYRLDGRYIGRDILTVVGGSFGGFDSRGIAERHSELFHPSDLAFDDDPVGFHRFIGRTAQHFAIGHVKT